MYPEIYSFTLFGKDWTIASYGTLIALGILIGTTYAARQAKRKLDIDGGVFWDMILMLIVVSVAGGKVFFWLEDPQRYIADPSKLFDNFGNGFVFYGSLIFGVLGLVFFFRWKKMPMLPMFDIIAIMATIIHAIGRLGCFMSGCCYGHEHDGWFSVTFTHELTRAPKDIGLYPTQIMSATMVFLIFLVLRFVDVRKQFAGQVALVYLMLYAIGRSIIEEFRGDEARGFIFKQAELLSHSQLISLLMFGFAVVCYYMLWKNRDQSSSSQTA